MNNASKSHQRFGYPRVPLLQMIDWVAEWVEAGRRVFEGNTAVDVCVQHVTAQPKPMSTHGVTVSAELEAVIMMCLAKQPSGRPADAGALAKLLGDVPQAGDWSEDQALTWWTEFRRLDRPSATTADTRTITVDIANREDE